MKKLMDIINDLMNKKVKVI